jgi:hypothetical protein
MTKREEANALLAELFGDGSRIVIADAVDAARERGISRQTLTRAGAGIGLRTLYNGRNKGIWEKPL